MLLRLINEHYGTIERERRGIVESMRLMADEAQALAHEARAQSSEHLQVILDHIKDVVLVVNEEGVIESLNPTGERVFGYTESQVTGQCIDLLIPKFAEGRRVPVRRSSGWRRASWWTRPSISRRVSCGRCARTAACSPPRSPSCKAPLARREMFVLCLRDVSERHASEQTVRDSAQRYQLLVDHAPEAIVVLDVDSGRFVDCQ